MRIVAGYKLCSQCHENKPVSAYFVDRQKASGIRPDCKSCNKAKSLAWARANPIKRKGYMIKHLYGLEDKAYAALMIAQDFCCAICNKAASSFTKALAVDHDHVTGKVRGLLCSNCNSGIGKLMEDEAILTRAIEYLKENSN